MLFKLRDTGQCQVGEGSHLLMKMLTSEACLYNGEDVDERGMFIQYNTGQCRVGEGAHLLMKMLTSEACLFNSGVHRSFQGFIVLILLKFGSLKV